MQKLSLNQALQQRLSPQQIQFIKLLQIPTIELSARIEEELEMNPALEEGPDELENSSDEDEFEEDPGADDDQEERTPDVERDLHDDEMAGYKMQGDGPSRDVPVAHVTSLTELLLDQLGYLRLDERHKLMGRQLIGSLESDGYLRRPLQAIANDLVFTLGIYTALEELERVLMNIQTFDPPGIAARNLRECMLLQLGRKDVRDRHLQNATLIVGDCFGEFSKKHYAKIQRKLCLDDEQLRCAINIIIRLNPKPGGSENNTPVHYLLPDFSLTNHHGNFELTLNARNAPELRLSRSFADLLNTHGTGDKTNRNSRETVSFVKQKLDAARGFIEAIRQRQRTLLRTMNAIVNYQYDFFLEGDETRLKPMVLRDIAAIITLDVSTVSRVVNSKAVQTEFGLYPLKYFFSEGIATHSGEDVSSREVKNTLKELIGCESKKLPLSDDKLEKILNERGYTIARRTVAKYREQLNIPVAWLRKQL